MPVISKITGAPFRFWCQKILPAVYDDSLSYYELLCKVVDYLNKVMEDDINVINLVNELEDFVNNYFDNLDVQKEINNKLDAMAEDGSLLEVVAPHLDDIIGDYEATLDADLAEYKGAIDADITAFKGTVNTNITNFETAINEQVSTQNTEISNFKSDVNETVAAQDSDITVMQSQMDNFIQSHSGELTFTELYNTTEALGAHTVNESFALSDDYTKYTELDIYWSYNNVQRCERVKTSDLLTTGVEISFYADEAVSQSNVAPMFFPFMKIVNGNVEHTQLKIDAAYSERWSGASTDSASRDIPSSAADYFAGSIIKVVGVSYQDSAELQDIRVAYDGTIYSTAGNSVRQQVSALNNSVNQLSDTVYPDNIYDMTGNVSGKRLQSNGNTYDTADYFTSDYIDVSFVGNKKLYLSKNNGDLANFMYVCWYDTNKNCISYSSTVEGSKNNDPNAKYMRFSASIANYELNTYINVGSRLPNYTPYFAPYKTTHWDKIVLFGYSNAQARYPAFNVEDDISILVNGFLTLLDRTHGKTLQIQKYNSTPETFIVSSNQALVFNYTTKELSVVSVTTLSENNNLIPLIIVNTNKIVSGGQWADYLNWQMNGRYYKEKTLPYSPRPVIKASNSNAGDQGMCIIGNWLVCWNAQDSDGLVHILDKTTKEQIKLMSHNLGHGGNLSYNAEADSLLISSTNGSYIFTNAVSYIENNTVFEALDAVYYDGVYLGVFGETPHVTYCVERVKAYDTLANYVIKRYSLGITNNTYDGTSTLLKTYKANYRFGAGQDCQFYNGYIYKAFGFRDAVIYKITLDELRAEYEVAESFNVPNSDTLEAEGLVVEYDTVLLSARDYDNTANKYFIEMQRL